MKVFTPSEINKIIPALGKKQINDLVDNDIIVPWKKSTGQGVTRLYDKKNIIDLLICWQIRGMMPQKQIKEFISYAHVDPKIIFIISKRTGDKWYFHRIAEGFDEQFFQACLFWDYDSERKYTPKKMDTASIVVNVKSTREFVEKYFAARRKITMRTIYNQNKVKILEGQSGEWKVSKFLKKVSKEKKYTCMSNMRFL